MTTEEMHELSCLTDDEQRLQVRPSVRPSVRLPVHLSVRSSVVHTSINCLAHLHALLRVHGTCKWNPIAVRQSHLNIVVIYQYRLNIQLHICKKNFCAHMD